MTFLERVETRPLLPEPFEKWFAARGWTPRTHQLDLLAKAQAGRSALLIAPTGAGKTLAGFLPTLVELYEQRAASPRAQNAPPSAKRRGEGRENSSPPAAISAAKAGCTRCTSRR